MMHNSRFIKWSIFMQAWHAVTGWGTGSYLSYIVGSALCSTCSQRPHT